MTLSGCGAPIADRRCTACGRPALLDAYCCQGGASAGYQRAGWCTTGVDKDPQPRYPWHFIQGEAVAFIAAYGHLFAAIHASPPCQLYSACHRIRGREHPDLIGDTRDALLTTGRPWVIENVEDARPELRAPVLLCGSMFPDLHTYRHRLFETSFSLAVPDHIPHGEISVKMGRPLVPGDWYHAVGNFSGVGYVRADLGFDWMNRDGLRESIPWQYAAHVGATLQSASDLASAVTDFSARYGAGALADATTAYRAELCVHDTCAASELTLSADALLAALDDAQE